LAHARAVSDAGEGRQEIAVLYSIIAEITASKENHLLSEKTSAPHAHDVSFWPIADLRAEGRDVRSPEDCVAKLGWFRFRLLILDFAGFVG
jgi:hypothetical protein